ncbi:UPF0149 family protein [Chitinibacteraceae bacterium HSL-7]
MTTPLTDTELERLDAFLMSPRTPEETMDLEMLDGFLVALAIGPTEVAEDHWLPQIFAGELPEFADETERDEVFGLIRRHAAFVHESFSPKKRSNVGEQPLYYPLVLSDEGADEKWQDTLGAYWATGFHAGMLADEEQWQTALDQDEELYNPVSAILALETGHELDDESKTLSAAVREERVSELPWHVEDIMLYWLEQQFGTVETVRNDEPKVGRNDPCPCGSGKKFKKCHGA